MIAGGEGSVDKIKASLCTPQEYRKDTEESKKESDKCNEAVDAVFLLYPEIFLGDRYEKASEVFDRIGERCLVKEKEILLSYPQKCVSTILYGPGNYEHGNENKKFPKRGGGFSEGRLDYSGVAKGLGIEDFSQVSAVTLFEKIKELPENVKKKDKKEKKPIEQKTAADDSADSEKSPPPSSYIPALSPQTPVEKVEAIENDPKQPFAEGKSAKSGPKVSLELNLDNPLTERSDGTKEIGHLIAVEGSVPVIEKPSHTIGMEGAYANATIPSILFKDPAAISRGSRDSLKVEEFYGALSVEIMLDGKMRVLSDVDLVQTNEKAKELIAKLESRWGKEGAQIYLKSVVIPHFVNAKEANIEAVWNKVVQVGAKKFEELLNSSEEPSDATDNNIWNDLFQYHPEGLEEARSLAPTIQPPKNEPEYWDEVKLENPIYLKIGYQPLLRSVEAEWKEALGEGYEDKLRGVADDAGVPYPFDEDNDPGNPWAAQTMLNKFNIAVAKAGLLPEGSWKLVFKGGVLNANGDAPGEGFSGRVQYRDSLGLTGYLLPWSSSTRDNWFQGGLAYGAAADAKWTFLDGKWEWLGGVTLKPRAALLTAGSEAKPGEAFSNLSLGGDLSVKLNLLTKKWSPSVGLEHWWKTPNDESNTMTVLTLKAGLGVELSEKWSLKGIYTYAADSLDVEGTNQFLSEGLETYSTGKTFEVWGIGAQYALTDWLKLNARYSNVSATDEVSGEESLPHHFLGLGLSGEFGE